MTTLTTRRQLSTPDLALAAAALLVIVGGAVVMAFHPVPALWDERALLEMGDSLWPDLSVGISSGLFAILVRKIAPDVEAAHGVARLFAFALYCGAGALLISRLTQKTGRRLLLFALLVTFRFGMLWLSSEVLAASFLALLLWASASERRGAAVVFVALFATAKPDLLLPGLACAAVLVASSGDPGARLRTAAFFAAAFLALLVPALALHGSQAFVDRAAVSFGQHYAALVAPHQANFAVEPWTNWERFTGAVFGGPVSALQAATRQPDLYADFVALSVSKSLQNFFRSGLWLLLPFAVLGMVREPSRRMKWLGVAVLLGLLPLVLTSFVHVRYLARYAVLLLYFTAVAWESLPSSRGNRFGIALGFVAGVQLFFALPVFAIGFWFPD